MDIKEIKAYNYNTHILIKNMGETVMAFNPSNGDMYELDEIGGEILEMLKNGLSVPEILKNLVEAYDADENEICEDLNPLFERFIELGIIKLK